VNIVRAGGCKIRRRYDQPEIAQGGIRRENRAGRGRRELLFEKSGALVCMQMSGVEKEGQHGQASPARD